MCKLAPRIKAEHNFNVNIDAYKIGTIDYVLFVSFTSLPYSELELSVRGASLSRANRATPKFTFSAVVDVVLCSVRCPPSIVSQMSGNLLHTLRPFVLAHSKTACFR